MAILSNSMPPIQISADELLGWGKIWLGTQNPQTGNTKLANCFDRQQSVNFATFIDRAFAQSLSGMLGNVPIEEGSTKRLLPPVADCVEMGPARVIGGIRPQNFDVAYRPDGLRVAFDSKTLNDLKSVGKNWQNMVNDLVTEASTVHTRFPYAIVAFMIVIPSPALGTKQKNDIVRTLERLADRKNVLNQNHLAEVISLLVWDPATGQILPDIPPKDSNLRIEKFSELFYPVYINRYKGLPPHDEVDIVEE